MKKISLVCILLSIASIGFAQQPAPAKNLKIAIVADGPWERNQEYFTLIQKEITEVVGKQAGITFPADLILEGNWTLESVHQINNRLLADANVDIILGMGLMASQDLCTRGDLPKLVLAPIVIDPTRQHIPFKNGRSGVKNLNYLMYPITFDRDIQLFREIVPIKKLVNIASHRYNQAMPPAPEPIEPVTKVGDIEIVLLFLDDSADDVLKAIPQDANAVYLEPNLHLPATEFKKLVQGFIQRRLPSFSFFGESEVRQGIMATANSDVFPRLIRRLALNLRRIIQGEDPASLSVTFPAAKRLYFNVATGNAVGVIPKWSTLLEAELIDVEDTKSRVESINLANAMQRILAENLDVQAKIREIEADARNIASARANLLPKLDLGATSIQIDPDRARAGYQPEKSASASVDLTQVLFSEPAIANLQIQSSLHNARKNELALTRLDNLAEGAKIYLNYLRAQKIYYILLDNLKITRSNLELAQIRQNTGVAGQDEPLRWEVEIANVRKAVMALHSQVQQIGYVLNQILNFPLGQDLKVEDFGLDHPGLFISNPVLRGYFEDPISFAVLTEFLVKEGLDRSHELQQLDAIIRAQERAWKSVRSSYIAPTLAAFANYSNNFYKSEQPIPLQPTSIPAPPEGLDPRVPMYLGQLFSAVSPGLPDRNNWHVGLQASINLFNGFGTRAAEQKALLQLNQYQIQRKSVAQRVELRIRAEMQNAKTSFFAIQQTRLEQEAARKGLDLATDAYSSGAVSILTLLDAQNSLLRANQVDANASYDFMIAYFQLQRSLGQIDLMLTVQDREVFMQRLLQFMASTLR